MKTLYKVCILLLILSFSLPSFNTAAQTDVRIIVAVAWSPDGETLAIGGSATSGQGAIWLYDGIGTAINAIYLPNTVFNVRWSRDGAWLAARYDTTGGTRLAIWDWETFDPNTPSVTTEEIRGPSEGDQIVWSPTGRYIAADDALSVHIIDAATGSQVAKLYDEERTGTSGIVGIEWAANEQSIYVLYDDGDVNQLLQWDVATIQVINTVLSRTSFFPITMRQSPDAQRLAISEGASGSVFLLSAPDFKVERELSVQQGESRIPYVAYLFWLEDNTSLLGLAYDGTSYLWNTTTGDLLARDTLISDRAIFLSDTAISPYGGRLALATRWRPTTPSATPAYDTYTTYQSLLESMVRIAVPAPSLDRLNAILDLCAQDAAAPIEPLDTLSTLSDFVASVKSLPDNAIPPACRADLLAMAEALQSDD